MIFSQTRLKANVSLLAWCCNPCSARTFALPPRPCRAPLSSRCPGGGGGDLDTSWSWWQPNLTGKQGHATSVCVCFGQKHSPLQTPAALVCPSRGFSVLRGQLCSLPGGHVSCLARCWSVFYHGCDVSSPFVGREDTFFIVPQRLWQESGGTGDWHICRICFWTRRDEASALVHVLACWGQMLRPSDVHVGATWDRSLSSVSSKHAGGSHTPDTVQYTPIYLQTGLGFVMDTLEWGACSAVSVRGSKVLHQTSRRYKLKLRRSGGKELTSQQTAGCFVPGGWVTPSVWTCL